MDDWLVIIAGLIIWCAAAFGIFTVYSNYQVCKQYYPQVSPWVCMASSKTRLVGQGQ